MTTRDQIIQTALKLFLSHGFEQTSMNEIAENVGITKPAIYHYFKNKNELLKESIDGLFTTVYEKFFALFPLNKPVQETLDHFFSSLNKILEIIPNTTGMNSQEFDMMGYSSFFTDNLSKNPLLMQRFNEYYENIINEMTEYFDYAKQKGEINPSLNSKNIAIIFLGLIKGTMQISLFDKKVNLGELNNDLHRVFWGYIKP